MVAVCVYCASSDGIAKRHLTLAGQVGEQIAARGWRLVSGGGSRSMMGAVAAAARGGGAALDACVAPVPGDGSRRSLRSRRGGVDTA